MLNLKGSDTVIVGYDCDTCAGEGVEAAYRSAASGDYGIGNLKRYANEFLNIGGELDKDWRQSKELRAWTDPSSLLLPAMIERTISRLELNQVFANEEMGLIAGSAFPGLTTIDNLSRVGATVKGVICGTAAVPQSKILMSCPLRGENHYVSTACASGGQALHLARALLGSQDSTKLFIICCWEFPLFDFVFRGFNLSRTLFNYEGASDRAISDPASASRPFSIDRAGMVPAEGLSVLAVTTLATAEAHGLPIHAVISGSAANGGAKSHMINEQSSLVTAIRRSLGYGSELPTNSDLPDLISAHANGNKLGDAIEANAFADVFGDLLNEIPVIAAQEYFGHTFGASMLLQIIMALEMMRRQELLPMRNYLPDPALPDMYVAKSPESRKIASALVTGFGFGGTNVSLTLKKPH